MFQNIRAEMARNKRKVAEIAAVLGISENSFRFKMNGKREFTLRELRVLAEHFDVTIDYLAAHDSTVKEVTPKRRKEDCARRDQ